MKTRRVLAAAIAAILIAPASAASASVSTTLVPAKNLRDPVVARFSQAVQGVSTDNFIVRPQGGSKVNATVRCRNGSGVTVSCAGSSVREAILTPSAALVTARRYTTVVNPAGASPIVRAGSTIGNASRAFRMPLTQQEASPGARYLWPKRSNSAALGRSFVTERTTGAQATFRFTGSSVTWFTIVGPGQGRAEVLIDGRKVRTVDNNAASTRYGVARRFGDLGAGAHRITIRVAGGGGVAIEGFRTAAGLHPDPALNMRWAFVRHASASGGRYARSGVPGARAHFSFRGKGIDLITIFGPSMGRFDVLVDGTRVRTVDAYAPTVRYGRRVSLAGLTDAVHRITIRTRSDRHPNATGRLVAIDAWQVREPKIVAFRKLGAWVDLWDYALVPETAAADMAARGVKTLYLQTARWNSTSDILYPDMVSRWVEAAHANGMRIVGWYLPAYAKWLDRDVRRTLAIARFRSANGQRFDALAVDIEYKGETSSLEEFNTGIRRHLARVRRGVGNVYPVGGIVPAPRGMALSPSSWAGFPWKAVGRYSDVVLPMGYWSYRTDCGTRPEHCAGPYTRNNILDARRFTGLPVHEIGGVADAITRQDVIDFVAASRGARAIGASLYDYATTRAGFWEPLADLNR